MLAHLMYFLISVHIIIGLIVGLCYCDLHTKNNRQAFIVFVLAIFAWPIVMYITNITEKSMDKYNGE